MLWRRGRLALGTPANEARLDISWPQFCHHKFQQWGSDWMPPLPVASVSGTVSFSIFFLFNLVLEREVLVASSSIVLFFDHRLSIGSSSCWLLSMSSGGDG